MATTVDTLLVRIESDMSDIRRDLRRLETQTGQTSNKVRRSLGNMGGAFKAVIGGVLVAQLARGTIALTNFASDMEEMSAMSEAVFGSFIHSVRDELDQFGEAVGRSRFDLEKMAASVQDTFVPLGFARGQAADLSVALTKLAVDVASFKNESEQATMQAFQSALVGNHEAVRRFGIVITEAELKAELFRMGITKNAKDVDAATKVQARLNLIMAGTKDAQGDAAKTSDSYANQTRALDAQLKLLAADVGNELLPVMKDLVAVSIDATKGFRDFLHAMGIGGSVTQQATRATQRRMVAEKELADVMDRVRRMAMTSRAANRLLHAAQMELAEASLEEEKAIKKLMEAKGLLNTETEKEASVQKKANTEISDAQKFVTNLMQESEILMLKKRGVSEATIAQKEAEHELGKEYIENKDLIDKMIQVNFDMNQELEKRQEVLDKIKESAEKAAEAQTKITDKTTGLKQANALLKAELNGATEAELEFMKVQQELGPMTDRQAEAIRKLIAENEAYEQVQASVNQTNQEARGFLDSLKTPMDDLLETQTAINAAYLNGALNTAEYHKAQDALSQKMKELDPQFKALKDAAERAADSVSDSLADAFVEGKLSMDSFKDIFKSFIKDLIKQAIKAAIIKHILGPIFGGGFAGGGSVGGGTFGASDSFASGGAVRPRAGGGPVLVGERGPELFVPHSSGVIRNNHDTKNMMGGGSPVVVNQNINIETGVAQTVRAEVMSMMPRIKSETVQAMIDGKRRGNSISKAFA